MITPAYSPTATERVLPRLALDFTTGVLDPRVTVTRALNTATRVNSSGLIEIVNANLPRFDYDPSTLAPKGLLIEETRSNLALTSTFATLAGSAGSQYPSGSGWVNEFNTGGTRTFVASALYASAQAMDIASVSSARNFISFSFSPAASTTYTVSFYVESLSGVTGAVSYATGTLGTGGSTGIVTAPTTTGRYSYTFTTGTSPGTVSLRLGIGTSGNASGSIRISNFQVEAGAFATSYIPTTTTSLTRNSDVVEMTGTNFSSWFNQTEGTFAVWFDTIAAGGPFNIWALSAADATPSGRYMIGGNPANLRGFVSAGGSTQADMFSGTIANNTQKKAVLAYKTDSFAFSTGGLAPTTDALGTLPTPTRMWIGQYNGTYLYGHVAQLLYWPQRLINAETSAFSK